MLLQDEKEAGKAPTKPTEQQAANEGVKMGCGVLAEWAKCLMSVMKAGNKKHHRSDCLSHLFVAREMPMKNFFII